MLEASRRDWVATAASLVTLLLLSVPALLQLPATSEGEASPRPRPRARYIPDTSSRAISTEQCNFSEKPLQTQASLITSGSEMHKKSYEKV